MEAAVRALYAGRRVCRRLVPVAVVVAGLTCARYAHETYLAPVMPVPVKDLKPVYPEEMREKGR
jgi:hypothetical protein